MRCHGAAALQVARRAGGRELGMITNFEFLFGDEGGREERKRERLTEMESKYYERFFHSDHSTKKERATHAKKAEHGDRSAICDILGEARECLRCSPSAVVVVI